jgi:hypothetical protein
MTDSGKGNDRLTIYVNKAIFSIETELANNCKLKLHKKGMKIFMHTPYSHHDCQYQEWRQALAKKASMD